MRIGVLLLVSLAACRPYQPECSDPTLHLSTGLLLRAGAPGQVWLTGFSDAEPECPARTPRIGVLDPIGDAVPVEVDTSRRGFLGLRFTPAVQGPYQVNVVFNRNTFQTDVVALPAATVTLDTELGDECVEVQVGPSGAPLCRTRGKQLRLEDGGSAWSTPVERAAVGANGLWIRQPTAANGNAPMAFTRETARGKLELPYGMDRRPRVRVVPHRRAGGRRSGGALSRSAARRLRRDRRRRGGARRSGGHE